MGIGKLLKFAAEKGVEAVKYFKRTERVNLIGKTKINTIFRGNRHIGSKIKYADGTTAETSVRRTLGVTEAGEVAPAKVFKTTTQMPDGTKVIAKDKLIKAGEKVEVKSSTTTKTASSRKVKQPAKPVVEEPQVEIKPPVEEKPHVSKFPGIKKLPPEAAKYLNWINGLAMAAGIGIVGYALVESLANCHWTSSVPDEKDNKTEDKVNDPFLLRSCSSPKGKPAVTGNPESKQGNTDEERYFDPFLLRSCSSSKDKPAVTGNPKSKQENTDEERYFDPFIFRSCSSPKKEPVKIEKTKPQQKIKAEPKEKKQDLVEYTPKRGESWISILKAKYGVDDVTAMAMAHRIKYMCYDDSLASKQSPVMYLPRVWNFNNKTYYYNDSTDAGRCREFSDEVKTEMGKMSKELVY